MCFRCHIQEDMAKLSTLADEKFGNEQGFEVDFSHLAARLPSCVPRDRIDVDVKTVLEICDLVRVDSLSVLGIDEKGEDRFVIHDAGGDGSIAGHANSTGPGHRLDIARPMSIVRQYDWHPSFGRSIDFRRASVFVNVAGLAGLENSRDPEAVAQLLDEAMKEQLWEIAKKRLGFKLKVFGAELSAPIIFPLANLYYGLLNKEIRNLMVFFGFSVFPLLAAMESETVLEVFSKSYLLIFALMKIIFGMIPSAGLPGDVRQSPANSFTLGDLEYDRLGLVWNLLRTKTLVSAVVEEENA